jgi:hypothetical protein
VSQANSQAKTIRCAPVAVSPHPRVFPSVLAVERALRWYAAEVPHAQAPPVTLAETEVLQAMLAGQRPREPIHFEQLVSFARTMFKIAQIDRAAPACNLGDVLTALAAVPQPGEELWIHEPAVDAAAFARLEFSEASAGIARTQRDNREGWWAHAQKNRAFIEAAARQTTGKQLAVVIGAGHAFDLPLVELARTFERLVLIDIDAAALAATVSGVFKDAALRARVEQRVIDLTGINAAYVRRLEALAGTAPSAADAHDAVERLCQGYRLATPPRLLPGDERADLVVSSCVLTQVAWPHRHFAERLFAQRFGPVRGAAEPRWAKAFSELELRIQQDHLTALAGVAEVVAFTSDVVSRVTALDAGGTERPTGQTILALGVPSLLERLPKLFQVDGHQTWEWGRYKATRQGKGSRMDVEGVVLTEPRRPSGLLWIP